MSQESWTVCYPTAANEDKAMLFDFDGYLQAACQQCVWNSSYGVPDMAFSLPAQFQGQQDSGWMDTGNFLTFPDTQ